MTFDLNNHRIYFGLQKVLPGQLKSFSIVELFLGEYFKTPHYFPPSQQLDYLLLARKIA